MPYDRYEEEKALRMEQLLRAHKKQQDEIAGLERFVERFKAKASKATLAQSKQKQLDKIERIVIPGGVSTIRLKFPEAPPSGQWVFEVEDLDKAYGDNTIFRDGKFGIQRGDHAVLVGPNGAGKTTLLKVLQGIETPTRGKVTIGAGVVVGYFAQYEEPTPAEAAMDLLILPGRSRCPKSAPSNCAPCWAPCSSATTTPSRSSACCPAASAPACACAACCCRTATCSSSTNRPTIWTWTPSTC